jgi:hypothetical protein
MYISSNIGKSWTMTGCPCHSEYGLIANAIDYVFKLIYQEQSTKDQQADYSIECAYVESKIC